MAKKSAYISSAIAALVFGTGGLAGFAGKQLHIYSICRDSSGSLMNKIGMPNSGSEDEEKKRIEELIEGERLAVMKHGLNFVLEKNPKEVIISSYDGLKLFGWLLPNKNEKGEVSNKTMLLMHGYRVEPPLDLAHTYQFFYEAGYNLLIPHQRSHGRSEGKYICYGTKERFDVQKWCEFLVKELGEDQTINLMGISMGAATVLMSTGLDLPEQVNKVIADCGFTSPLAEFQVCMEGYGLKHNKAILKASEFWSKKEADFGYSDYSTLEAMKVNKHPILFIHGKDDDFVPPVFTKQNYAACQAPKEVLYVEGAKHALSGFVNPKAYFDAIERFLQ